MEINNFNSLTNLSFDEARVTDFGRKSKDFFFRNGYLLVDNIIDSKLLFETPPPNLFGQYRYKKIEGNKFIETQGSEVEKQVPGSLSRYSYPLYKDYQTYIRLKLEKIIGEKLYNTYYYDRFYYVDQELTKHVDRDSCEISVSIQISTNSKNPWEFCLIDLSGNEKKLKMKNGFGVVYLGCDVLHWRDSLKSRHSKLKRKILNLTRKKDDTYHHQIFFHYVLANGHRCHFANDSIK